MVKKKQINNTQVSLIQGFKKTIKSLKKDLENLKERYTCLLDSKKQTEIENKNLKKQIKELTRQRDAYKDEVNMLYDMMNEDCDSN